LLAVYVEDHHAAVVAGYRLAARLATTTASERSEAAAPSLNRVRDVEAIRSKAVVVPVAPV